MNEYLPIIAILISLLSLGVSIAPIIRDRSKLTTSCKVFKHEETDEYSHLYIKAVNKGRRPLTLLYLMGVYTKNEKSGYQLKAGGEKLEKEHSLKNVLENTMEL